MSDYINKTQQAKSKEDKSKSFHNQMDDYCKTLGFSFNKVLNSKKFLKYIEDDVIRNRRFALIAENQDAASVTDLKSLIEDFQRAGGTPSKSSASPSVSNPKISDAQKKKSEGYTKDVGEYNRIVKMVNNSATRAKGLKLLKEYENKLTA